MTKPQAHPSTPPLIRQLPLPFPVLEPIPPCLPTSLHVLPPQQVWMHLPPTSRIQVRRTLLSVMQEVLDEPRRA